MKEKFLLKDIMQDLEAHSISKKIQTLLLDVIKETFYSDNKMFKHITSNMKGELYYNIHYKTQTDTRETIYQFDKFEIAVIKDDKILDFNFGYDNMVIMNNYIIPIKKIVSMEEVFDKAGYSFLIKYGYKHNYSYDSANNDMKQIYLKNFYHRITELV